MSKARRIGGDGDHDVGGVLRRPRDRAAANRYGGDAMLMWLRGVWSLQGGKKCRDAGAAHDHGRIRARQHGSAGHSARSGWWLRVPRAGCRVGAVAIIVGSGAGSERMDRKAEEAEQRRFASVVVGLKVIRKEE